MTGSELDRPHHDGSALYVSNPYPDLGDRVTLFVRVPHAAGVSRVLVRSTPDAEPHFEEARVDRRGDDGSWWRVDLEIRNPVTNYRFLLQGGPTPYRWLTADGVRPHDLPDRTDFRLVTFDPPPEWVADSVFYQIFPDRFASSGARRDLPSWAIPAGWDDPVLADRDEVLRQVYGGDLPGVEQHLGHLEALGVNAVYMTPFFPAGSSHRYDASSFDQVDPLLGGDGALISLIRALHGRGWRLVGDLTANHCGNTHPWFLRGLSERGSVESTFFFWKEDGGYESWFDVPSLPKLDHRSSELRRRLYEGPTSVAARWLRPPFELDGWRVDVANMAARYQDMDLNHELAMSMRRTMAEVKPEAYLLAEHGHDATEDLMGDGWHGTMSYAGFTRPVWCWLGSRGSHRDWDFLGVPVPLPRFGGGSASRTIDLFRASIPWRSWTHNLTLLGSHDTARWRSVAAGQEVALVGAGVLLTFPGVPCIFAGDEVGLEGVDSHRARRSMPWDRSRWDLETLDRYRALIRLRREHVALRRGGFRWVHRGDDALAYLRETSEERILVQASRASHTPLRLPASGLGLAGPATGLLAEDDLVPEAGGVTLPSDGPAFHAWTLG